MYNEHTSVRSCTPKTIRAGFMNGRKQTAMSAYTHLPAVSSRAMAVDTLLSF